MRTQDYVIRYVDGLWQIRRGGRLIGAGPSRMEALHVADAMARAGADRGEQSTIAVRDIDGSIIEMPTVGPA